MVGKVNLNFGKSLLFFIYLKFPAASRVKPKPLKHRGFVLSFSSLNPFEIRNRYLLVRSGRSEIGFEIGFVLLEGGSIVHFRNPLLNISLISFCLFGDWV